MLDFIAAQDYYKLVSFWEHPNLAEASEELNSAGEWLDQAGLEAEEAGYDIRHYACQEDRVNILETIASTRRPSQSSSVVEAANLLPFQYLRTRKTEKELVHMHHDRLYNCRREFEAIAGRPFEESNHATQEDTVLLTRTVKARDNLISSMNQARVDGFSVGSDGSLLGRALTGPESLEIERRPRDRLEVDARATLLRAGVGRYLATVLPLQCQTLRQYGVVDTLDAKEAALTSVAKGLEIRKPPTLYTVPDDETKSEYGKRMALIHHMTLTRDRARVRNELRTFDPARRFSAESCECPICKGEVELG